MNLAYLYRLASGAIDVPNQILVTVAPCYPDKAHTKDRAILSWDDDPGVMPDGAVWAAWVEYDGDEKFAALGDTPDAAADALAAVLHAAVNDRLGALTRLIGGTP